jgi:hypothetical protein
LDLSDVELYPDNVFSASDSDWFDSPQCARVNDHNYFGDSCVWRVSNNQPPNNWLQIHLPVHKIIKAIELVSRNDGWNDWITKYKIAYASESQAVDGIWETPDTEYDGNTDQAQSVISIINIATPIKILRIIPTEYQGAIATNIELYGNDAVVGEQLGPDTIISSSIPSPSFNTVSTSVTFSASEPRSTFRCALSGQIEIPTADCSSPYTIPAYTLPVGLYQFTVSATDASNIQGTPQTLNFEIVGKFNEISLSHHNHNHNHDHVRDHDRYPDF